MMIGLSDDLSVLDLRHLAALDAVVTEGTFARAASRLNYSQSTLSQQIAGLERAVHGRVFDRPAGPRRPQLTPLGQVVLEQARALLGRSASAAEAIDRFHAGLGRIDVGTFQTVTAEVLPAVVRTLRRDRPGCDIRLFEDEVDDVSELAMDRLDVAFFDGPGAAGLDQVEIVADEHVVVLRRDEAPPGPIALADLHDRVMVGLPPICEQRRVEAAFAAAGVRPDFVFRTADNHSVTAMVRAGLGIAVLPMLAVGPLAGDVVLRALTPALPPRRISLLSRGTRSPLAQALIDAAVAVGAELIADGRTRLGPG